MTPVPTRNTPAGRIYNDLRNLAKRHGREPAEYFTLYTLEGFLERLAASAHSDDFVLKGGVLMAAFAARRPTRDIDLSASGFGNDIADVEQRVREVIAQPIEDGLEFDAESVAGEPIRDETDYSGVRVKITAGLGSHRAARRCQFRRPDLASPDHRGTPQTSRRHSAAEGYPDHMVLAEKIVTAIDRGEVNTRWRDFVDINEIAGTRAISAGDLREAIHIVANHRGVRLEPLAQRLSHMPELAQAKWATWRRKQRLTETTPVAFAELLDTCVAFADPILTEPKLDGIWNPVGRAWSTE